MKTLFLSVATSGIPDFKLRASDPRQPHIVEVSTILCEIGKPEVGETFTVKPDGWTIPLETTAIHRVTPEIAANGNPEAKVAAHLWELLHNVNLIVCYNATFQKYALRIAFRRFGLMQDSDKAFWDGLNAVCVMKEMTPICGLVSDKGRPKFPKLKEAFSYVFRTDLAEAGTTVVDVAATKRIYQWLNPAK